MKKNNKVSVNDFWKLNGNKVIHCTSSEQAEILLEVFKRMESAEKVTFTKYGDTYMNRKNESDKQDRCFDNMEHDFDYNYYKQNSSYAIYEFESVDLSEYLTKEEVKTWKKLIEKQPEEPQMS